LPIAVDNPTERFGWHVAVLVSPGSESREARWLAVGLDEDAAAPHVVEDGAASALRRVRFLDRGRTATLSRDLKAGTVVVLMDGHGPSATQVPRLDVALLSSVPSVLAAPEAGRELVPRTEAKRKNEPNVERVEIRRRVSPASSSHARAPSRRAAASQAEPAAAPRPRKRGPLDDREAWPHSMYWPY
jgi:hypothetical protein